jgi:hypothetical protein
VLRTSLSLALRLCSSRVVGPVNCRKSLSPQIVRRDQVRIRYAMFAKNLYVSPFLMFCTNLEEGKKLPNTMGTWRFMLEDLKR